MGKVGLYIVLYAHMNVHVCAGVLGLYGGVEVEEGGGVLRIIALQSFLDRPDGVLMSQEGFGCCWFPLNGRGILLSSFSLPLLHNQSVYRLSRPALQQLNIG